MWIQRLVGVTAFPTRNSGQPGTRHRSIDFLPSFEGLARTRKRAAQMFVELVEGVIVKQDDSWTRNRVIGTEVFVKKVLGWTSCTADPPL